MSVNSVSPEHALRSLDGYDRIIDARSESEFALDRLPGAVNWPTLNDEQRHIVGTEYKQVSPFAARKRGAALSARNIADHIERELGDAGRDWRPLVYCWRGGKRSGSLALVLDQIGFKVDLVEGGYQGLRRALVTSLDELAPTLRYQVLCGTTGSGKSRLLQVLQGAGEQVLDLEAIAEHRGSVLGLVPGVVQPSQKAFDTRVWDQLRRFDPGRPVWVESESKKVGALRVPDALIDAIRQSPCWRIDLSVDARVALLMADYDFFVADIEAFCERLDALRELRGSDVIDRWQAAARSGAVEDVVRELLLLHYDPIYLRSIERNFAGYRDATVLQPRDGSWEALREVAKGLTTGNLALP
ncbi:tRNA 2-selenouridine(34) synthase MnmH [Piscinibacter sakaiensis]|uniref:tRNA 2-selenouridine(34) synthase MnmH n=1 Tax=Piscinibacter sakaiensis TaxID=1547922 RepID=UPI003AAF7040